MKKKHLYSEYGFDYKREFNALQLKKNKYIKGIVVHYPKGNDLERKIYQWNKHQVGEKRKYFKQKSKDVFTKYSLVYNKLYPTGSNQERCLSMLYFLNDFK